MKFVYKKDSQGRYYITIGNNQNIHNSIPLMLKIPKEQYEELLRENGAVLELDGKMYFYNKDKIIIVINHLNCIRIKR